MHDAGAGRFIAIWRTVGDRSQKRNKFQVSCDFPAMRLALSGRQDECLKMMMPADVSNHRSIGRHHGFACRLARIGMQRAVTKIIKRYKNGVRLQELILRAMRGSIAIMFKRPSPGS